MRWTNKRNLFEEALNGGTRFGVGVEHEKPQAHPVMDQDWSVTRITRERKDKAWKQLGTSGSGNHFVEFGVLTLPTRRPRARPRRRQVRRAAQPQRQPRRGCGGLQTYSQIAQRLLPKRYKDLGRLAWLDLESEAGQEYWAAMNLMGDYAAANHEVIHRLVSKLLGAEIIAGVENHHNFAWKETTRRPASLIVHRKGATPAGEGVLGRDPRLDGRPGLRRPRPGQSAEPQLGVARRRPAACRARAANDKFRFQTVRKELEARGVHVLAAGSDEVPGVYKDIHQVMAAQEDLVEIVAQFDPKIVKMCGDGSKAED